MIKRLKPIIFLIFSLSFIGCTFNGNNTTADELISPSLSSEIPSADENKNATGFTLNVLCHAYDHNKIKIIFNSLYPKATINITVIDTMDSNAIINAVADNSENSPDLIIYSLDYIGEFNAINAFENLLNDSYSFDNIKNIFPESDINSCMSMDKTKLIALPFTQASTVTYYRSDILENLGIPSDPEELALAMETAEGWLEIAKKLKEENIYALQWKDAFVKLTLNSQGVFDDNMDLNIENDKMKDALLIANESYNLGLISRLDLWTDEGRNAVRNGEIAMIHLNKWGENYLKETTPNTIGKWRVTRLPLGLYSSENTNAISIVATSKYKTQAWKLAKALILDENTYYKSITYDKSEFLGNQDSNLLYRDISNKLPLINRTMLDDTVSSILLEAVNNHTDKTLNVDNFLSSIKVKITNQIGNEQRILSNYITN